MPERETPVLPASEVGYHRRMSDSKGAAPPHAPMWHLIVVGALVLFWELVFIRWLSSSIRVVSYYSNFVLTAVFFGLGLGSLASRFDGLRLDRYIGPALTLGVAIGAALTGYHHFNPGGDSEYVWIGAPFGLNLSVHEESDQIGFYVILVSVYLVTTAAFAMLGYRAGLLFRRYSTLKAYSYEIFGSLCGLLLFAAMSWLRQSPVAWVAVGFLLLLPITERRRFDLMAFGLSAVAALLLVTPVSGMFRWSPYYKIFAEPLTEVLEKGRENVARFESPVGVALSVNNDYHQMLLDLRPHAAEHPFLTEWRELYDLPYRKYLRLPEGPILIVGAGTGNDVAAALRNTTRPVTAVEIDPVIIELGRELHFEEPYKSPRVTIVNDDARSFFQRTDERYAAVVFGFLDSHTLLSSFSSLRLDNFVYTRESLARVRELLLPGGRVFLTFAVNRSWINDRLVRMLGEVFDQPPEMLATSGRLYANGVVYTTCRPAEGDATCRDAIASAFATTGDETIEAATDDWPFLYLKDRSIPGHYRAFILTIVLLGALALVLLPRGQRQLKLPYLFMGAAFFLLEASNVVALSLLFGSTWTVNVLVFGGILLLVLLANLASGTALRRLPRLVLFGLLLANLVAAWLVPSSALLAIQPDLLRYALAIAVFLGPVFFSSLIFASLIDKEENLHQAYGSNLLGALLGAGCEYASLLLGFKTLLLVPMALYAVTFALLVLERRTRGLA